MSQKARRRRERRRRRYDRRHSGGWSPSSGRQTRRASGRFRRRILSRKYRPDCGKARITFRGGRVGKRIGDDLSTRFVDFARKDRDERAWRVSLRTTRSPCPLVRTRKGARKTRPVCRIRNLLRSAPSAGDPRRVSTRSSGIQGPSAIRFLRPRHDYSRLQRTRIRYRRTART